MQTAEQWLTQDDFTLVLSSGFFGFFCHLGFFTALEERGIRPRKIVGCSAGALVASGIASGQTCAESKKILFDLKKKDFWDPGFGFGLLKGLKFDQILRETSKESFEACDLPVQFVVLDIFKWKTTTISSGDLCTGVRASCAVPIMFHPVRHEGTWYWDGGVFDKIALTGLRQEKRVLCHYLYSPKEPFPNPALGIWPKEMNRLIGSNEMQWRGLMINKVPRVGPNQLSNGPLAFDKAYQVTKEWLDLPFENRVSIQ